MLFLLILNLCYMKKYISSFIQPYLAFAASACSIIGLAVVIVSDKDATIIALITLCMLTTLYTMMIPSNGTAPY